MRKLIGVIVGVVTAIILVDTTWAAANAWFPAAIPADADDTQILARFVIGMPRAGQAVIAIGWFVAGFGSAYAGLRVSQWRPAGWIASVAVVACGIWDMTQIVQPFWLQAAAVIAPLAGAGLAERYFHRARPGDPLIN